MTKIRIDENGVNYTHDATMTRDELEYHGAVFQTHETKDDVALLWDGSFWYLTKGGHYIIGGHDAPESK
jgi:hypothetical protein